MTYIAIRNWREFQHYTDRRPPWVKLHVSILDNAELAALPPASQLVAYKLLAIASKSDNRTTDSSRILAGWMQLPTKTVTTSLKHLERIGFIDFRFETESEIQAARNGQMRIETASSGASGFADDASARARAAEAEKQELGSKTQRQPKRTPRAKPLPSDDQDLIQKVVDAVCDSPASERVVRMATAGRPAALIARSLESTLAKQPPPRSLAAYFVGTLNDLIAEKTAADDDEPPL